MKEPNLKQPYQNGIPMAILYNLINNKTHGKYLLDYQKDLPQENPEYKAIKALLTTPQQGNNELIKPILINAFNALQKKLKDQPINNIVESILNSAEINLQENIPLLSIILSLRKSIKPPTHHNSSSKKAENSDERKISAEKKESSPDDSYLKSTVRLFTRRSINFFSESGQSVQFFTEICCALANKILYWQDFADEDLIKIIDIHITHDNLQHLNSIFSIICELQTVITIANASPTQSPGSSNEEHSTWVLAIFAAVTGKYTKNNGVKLDPSLGWDKLKTEFFERPQGLSIPYLLYSTGIPEDKLTDLITQNDIQQFTNFTYNEETFTNDQIKDIYKSLPSSQDALSLKLTPPQPKNLDSCTAFQALIIAFKDKPHEEEAINTRLSKCIACYSYDTIISLLPFKGKIITPPGENDTLLQKLSKGHIDEVNDAVKEDPTLIPKILNTPDINIIPTLQIILSYFNTPKDEIEDLSYWIFKKTQSLRPKHSSDHDKKKSPSSIPSLIEILSNLKKAEDQHSKDPNKSTLTTAILKSFGFISSHDRGLLDNYFSTPSVPATQEPSKKETTETSWNKQLAANKKISNSDIKAYFATIAAYFFPNNPSLKKSTKTYLTTDDTNLNPTMQFSNAFWNSIMINVTQYVLLFFVTCVGINIAVDLIISLPIKTYTYSQLLMGGGLFTLGLAVSLYITHKAWQYIGPKIFSNELPKPIVIKPNAKSSSYFSRTKQSLKQVCTSARDYFWSKTNNATQPG